MEALILTLLMVGIAMAVFGGGSSTPVAAHTPTLMMMDPAHTLTLRSTTTVRVNDPSELGRAINRIVDTHTGNRKRENYIIGTPHISPDGLTANIPLYFEPSGNNT
jgi:hypothetical protein